MTRHTLGAKKDNKLIFLEELSRKFDNLKYFITILWEAKGLETTKYTQLSQKLVKIGTMLGGWIAMLKKETPPSSGRE